MSLYLTGTFSDSVSSLLEDEEWRERFVAMRIAFFSASSGSLDSLPSSCSTGGTAKFIFEDEALELLRGVTTPAVEPRVSFGMLGFRALLIVFEKPFLRAAAATLVGVLGVSGVSISFSSVRLELE